MGRPPRVLSVRSAPSAALAQGLACCRAAAAPPPAQRRPSLGLGAVGGAARKAGVWPARAHPAVPRRQRSWTFPRPTWGVGWSGDGVAAGGERGSERLELL